MNSVPAGTTDGGGIHREYRQELRRILSQDDSTPRVQEILQLGADWFDVQLGLLVQVDPSGETYTIEEVSSAHSEITRGLTGDLLSTYCRMVVAEEEPLVLENALEQDWRDDPAYQDSLLATYIGTEVLADREVYGTVCFVDLEPRDAPFDDEDRTFLELIANGVGRVLEQQAAADAERQDTPRDLSMGERRYRTALKHSPVLFAKVDEDLRYEWLYNPHPDFDPEAAVGKRDDELDSGPGIDRLMDLKRRTLERGEQIREEITFERSDGLNVYDVTATPLREGPGDEVTGLITASLNITEQKETERKYRESEARYRALAENFPDGAVGIYDRDLRYTLVEGTLVGEVLPDAGKMEGSRMPGLFPEDTVADIEPLFRAAVEQGVTDSVETQYEGRDWKVWATPLRGSEGEIYGGLSFAQDVTDQKREVRKRQQVIRRVTDAIVEVDSEWRFTLVNDAAEVLYDMAEAELLGKNFWDVFETALGTRFEETYRRVMETREPDSLVEHFPRLDGWFDVEVYPNEDGGLAFYFQEVTEQKEREAALRRQRNLLEQTQRLAGAWEVDLQSRELSWSEEVYRIHDVPLDADIGFEEAFEFFPPEAQAKLRAAFERCVEEGDPYDLELPLVTADDDRRWVRAVGAPAETENGEVVRVAGAFQDITERKETEEELRGERNFLDRLLQSSPNAIVCLNPDGTFVQASGQSEDVLGVSQEEIIGRTYNDPAWRLTTLEGDPIPDEELPFARIMETGEPVHDVRLSITDPDGRRRFLSVSGAPLRHDDGEIEEVVFHLSDITERERAEAELRNREAQLRGLTNSVPGVVFQAYARPGREYGFYHVSEHAEDLLGISRDPSDFFERCMSRAPGSERERLMEVIDEAVSAGEQLEFEAPFVKPSGETIWLLGTAMPESRGDELVYNGVILDITQRKKAERALQEREARLRGLAHSIPGVVVQFYARADGTYGNHFVSEHAETVLGIPSDPDTFLERAIERVPPSHREELRASIETAIAEEESWRVEVPFDRPDGERIWLLGTSTPQRRGDELVFNGVLLDITEQKMAERHLRKERNRFATLFHNLPTPVVHGEPDEEGRLRARRVNAAFESVFGLAEEEVRGEDIQALIVPSDEQASADSIRRRLLAGEPVDREVRRKTTTGPRDFRVQVALREGESGPEEGYAIYTDITERKRRERILQERQANVEALYRATDRLLRAEDEQQIAASILDLVNEVFGYLVGVRLARNGELVPVQLSPEIPEHVPPRPSFNIEGESVAAKAFREGETLAFDDLRTADDPFDYGEVRAAAIIPIGEHGTISVGDVEVGGIDDFDRRLIEVLATYASTAFDRLDREDTLIEAKEQAEEAARLKASMMANMSHEIRTPLTSVIGFAEILAERLEGELGTFAQRAHRSSNRLMKTLESVLELSRLEAGTFDLNRESVQLSVVVESTVERLRPEARRKGLSLTADLPDREVTGLLNEEAVRRILENLLENAIKFTPDGGAVEVRLRRDEEEIVLEVEDTGVGISEEAIPEIFEAFKQESEGLDREYEGSGLGLSIVQEMTGALGGTLEVETEKGEGSRFTVRLPRRDEDSSAED